MKSEFKIVELLIGGMTCESCQDKIQKELQDTTGIRKVEVNNSKGTATITYDTAIISLNDIAAIINGIGYEVLEEKEQQMPNAIRAFGLLVIIISLYIFLEHFGILDMLVPGQLREGNMGYGMMFMIGLVTSVHCIAMCGGINLSQCIPKDEESEGNNRFSSLRPAFLYNIGRIISYTIMGFALGLLGSVITFSDTAQGILKLAAGVFMVIMGINMLGIFPGLRRSKNKKPKKSRQKLYGKGPLIIGLLNSLMPCGPLQAMKIYALSVGSPLMGAISLLVFCLGTVPLMFILGAASSLMGKKTSKRVMIIGAVLVAVLGLSMFSQGWTLSGLTFPDIKGNMPIADSVDSFIETEDIVIIDGNQVVDSTFTYNEYLSSTNIADAHSK